MQRYLSRPFEKRCVTLPERSLRYCLRRRDQSVPPPEAIWIVHARWMQICRSGTFDDGQRVQIGLVYSARNRKSSMRCLPAIRVHAAPFT